MCQQHENVFIISSTSNFQVKAKRRKFKEKRKSNLKYKSGGERNMNVNTLSFLIRYPAFQLLLDFRSRIEISLQYFALRSQWDNFSLTTFDYVLNDILGYENNFLSVILRIFFSSWNSIPFFYCSKYFVRFRRNYFIARITCLLLPLYFSFKTQLISLVRRSY